MDSLPSWVANRGLAAVGSPEEFGRVTRQRATISTVSEGAYSAHLLADRFATATNPTVATRYTTEPAGSLPFEPVLEIGFDTSRTAAASCRLIDPTNSGVVTK
jgi:hypothetical protein